MVCYISHPRVPIIFLKCAQNLTIAIGSNFGEGAGIRNKLACSEAEDSQWGVGVPTDDLTQRPARPSRCTSKRMGRVNLLPQLGEMRRWDVRPFVCKSPDCHWLLRPKILDRLRKEFARGQLGPTKLQWLWAKRCDLQVRMHGAEAVGRDALFRNPTQIKPYFSIL
jgi:hypothetical protein